MAARSGNIKLVKALLKKKADVNALSNSGNTVLIGAVYYKHKKIIQLLLANGADLNKASAQGETVLRCAVRMALFDMVKLFILLGSDINAETELGHTALMEATETGQLDMVDYLIANGANVNHVADNDPGKNSALSLSVSNGYTEIAFRLLTAMLPEQRMNALAGDHFLNNIIMEYNQAVSENRNKLFTIFGPLLMKENQKSFSASRYSVFSPELMARTLYLSSYFPLWYKHRLIADLMLTGDVLDKMCRKNQEEIKIEVEIENTRRSFSMLTFGFSAKKNVEKNNNHPVAPQKDQEKRSKKRSNPSCNLF